MPFDDLANGRQETGHVASLHPLPAARIEHSFELFHNKGDIAATPEDGRDHARQCHSPGIVLEILRVDEDFERAAAAVLDNIIQGHIDGVVRIWPFELVCETRQRLRSLQRFGHVDDIAPAWARGRNIGNWNRRQRRAERQTLLSFLRPVCSRFVFRQDRARDRVRPIGRTSFQAHLICPLVERPEV